MSLPHSKGLSVASASPKSGLLNAAKRFARKHRRTGGFRALSFGLAIAALTSSTRAATYYWDDNGATPGFGAPSGGATDTWSSTASLFTTDATGATAPTGTVATTTADAINFGTATLGLGTGTINVSGTVASGAITFGAASGAITLSGGTITLGTTVGTGNITNSSASLDTITSALALSAVQTVTMTGGGGNIFLGGNISGTGGGLALAGAGTLTLSGANSYTGATTVSNGQTLQLQANAGNTSGVVSTALNAGTYTGLTLNNGAAVQLRADSSLTFGGFNSLSGVGNATINFDVNQLTAAGTNNVITVAPSGFNYASTIINVTGGNGYSLALGPLTSVAYSGLTLNPSTANLSVASIVNGGQPVNVGGSGNTAVPGVISGTGALVRFGTGKLTLTGANTYTGATMAESGTLALDFSASGAPTTNIINTSANTSGLVLSGGTLNLIGKASATNTQRFASLALAANSSSAITLTQNGATALSLTLAGITRNAGGTFDLTLPTAGTVTTTTTTSTGTNKINGNGIAYSTANGGTTWLVNNAGTFSALASGSYSVDNFAASSDVDVQSNDTPAAFTVNTLRFNTASKTLTLNSSGVSTATAGGILVTSAGTGSVIASGGSGAGLTAGATGKEVVIHDYADLSISAPIIGTGIGLTVAGTGTTTLSGANTYTGATSFNSGRLNLTGSITATTTVAVGGGANGGAVYQSGSGSVLTNTSTAGGGFQIGAAVGTAGYYNLAAGTVNVGGELDPGGSAGGVGTFGQLDVSGGTINLPSAATPYFLPDRGAAGEASVVNISGGAVQILGGATVTNSAFNGLAVGIGNVSGLNSTITISGTGQFLTPSLTTKLNDTNFGATGSAANVSVLNMNGGTLQTLGFGTAVNSSTAGSNNAVINFNGGTIKAGSAANTAFLGGLGAVNVFSGGGTLDNNGQAITVSQPLLAASGTGVTSLAVSAAGAGYTVPPRVVFSGGQTVGGFLSNTATGYATISPTTGAVTGIVITNPGSYTSTSGLTVQLVGGGTTSASLGALTLNSGNTSGGLTFAGSGTTTLSGVDTYTGATAINAGTVRVSGSLASASNVSVASSATLAGGAGATAGTNTIGGATTSAGTLAPGGVGTVGTLFFGNNLSLTGGSVVLDLSGASNTTGGTTNDLLAVTGNLGASGTVIVSPTFSSTPAANTVYTIATYGSLSGATSFAAGSRAITLSNTGASNGSLLLTYTGATSANLRWNSTSSGAWDVVTTPNWLNLATNAQDYFYQGDAVTFDDTPGLQTAISINTTVLPSSVLVNSNTNNYSYSGSGGIGGTASLTKSGTSTLTINTANTYSGGTIINGGVVKVGNATALGASSGAVSVAAGAALDLNGTTISNTNALTLNGTGVSGGGALTNNSATAGTYAGLVTLGSSSSIVAANGNITLSNTGTITGSGFNLTLDGAATGSSIASIIGTGAGSLTKNGTGTWALTNTGTFTGGTTINAGTLSTAYTVGAANSSLVVGANGTLNFAGNAGNTGISNTITGTGNVTNSGIAVITGDASGFAGTWTANSQNSLNSAAVGGVVPATSANAAYVTNFAGTNALILGTPGTYNLGSLSGTIGELRGGNTLSASGTAVTASIGNLNTNTTFAGVIADNANAGTTVLSLTKVGTGTLTLSGANAYSGATTITGGTLAAASTTGNYALYNTASIAVNGGGTLLFSQPNQVNPTAVASTSAPKASVTLGVAGTSVGNLSAAAGASQGTAATVTNGGTANGGTTTGTTAQGLGALTLNNSATLAFGGASTTLVFNTFTPITYVLTITGYSNTNFNASTMTSGSGTDDRLVFFGDQSGNYNDFNFGAGAGVGVTEVALDGGFYEVYGSTAPVPEPATWLGGILLAGAAGYGQRRRMVRRVRQVI